MIVAIGGGKVSEYRPLISFHNLPGREAGAKLTEADVSLAMFVTKSLASLNT